MNNPVIKVPPIWFLAFCTASAVIGMTALTPALPIIKSDLNATGESVQQLLTTYLLALALGQLICGPLSDKTGRRPVLIGSAVLFTVAGTATVLSKNIEQLIALRFIQGLGAAGCMAMTRAIVNDAFERDDAARTMSTISTILAVVPALTLAFGGLLAESLGWRGSMGLLAIGAIIVLCLSLKYGYETNLHPIQHFNFRTLLTAYRTVLSKKLFLLWTMAGGMQVGIFFSLNAFLVYQYERNGYSMTEFGFWFALTPVFYILGNTCNRIWFVSRGLEITSLIGCLLSAVAVIAMFLTQSIGMTHALSLAIPSALFGFSNGLVLANSTAGAISAAGKFAGTGTGITGAWQMATGGIAGAIIAVIGGDQNFSIAIAVLIVMSVIAVVSMWVVRKSMKIESQAKPVLN